MPRQIKKFAEAKKLGLKYIENVKETTSDCRMFILRNHAEGYDAEKISVDIQAKLKLRLSKTLISSLCSLPQNKIYIEQFRAEYLSRVKEVPIANKRCRIDDLQRMRNELFEAAKQLDVTEKQGRMELLMIFRRVNEIICVAREEMEGKAGVLNQINITELTNMSDDELQRRKDVLVAKALGTYKERNIGLGEDSEGTASESQPESIEVSVAAPGKL